MNTVKIDKYFKGMIAHRGLSGIETENTINSFTAAANRSYYGMECDIQPTKDNNLVISHDDTLLRLGLLNLFIPSFRYEEIRKFSLIDRKTGNLSENIYIPLFTDYLLICKTYKKHAIIELKGNLTNDHIDDLIRIIRSMGMTEKSTLISFVDRYLLYVKKNYPEFDLYLLAGQANDKVLEFCEKNQINLDVRFDAVDDTLLKRLHLIGLKVNAWTVDDKDTAEKLIKLGIDYITSNILE